MHLPDLEASETAAASQPAGEGRGVETLPRTFKLIIAYDGSQFCGWQRQAEARTVQATLEDAIMGITGDSRVRLLASSRTDTGVHALGQCATFRSRTWKAPATNLPLAINTQLPDDVVVRAACEMPMSFNPIRNARGKRYRYSIYASRVANPLARRQAWWVKRRLDIEAMRLAAELLVGRHDFASFQTAGSPRQSTFRTVSAIDISSVDYMDGQSVTIEIEADGFLYNMVRNVVGTLVLAGRRHKSVAWVGDVLKACDRRHAGPTAPAHGLCLLEIYF
jgi:tRNA pseudouridine38-40 synthase